MVLEWAYVVASAVRRDQARSPHNSKRLMCRKCGEGVMKLDARSPESLRSSYACFRFLCFGTGVSPAFSGGWLERLLAPEIKVEANVITAVHPISPATTNDLLLYVKKTADPMHTRAMNKANNCPFLAVSTFELISFSSIDILCAACFSSSAINLSAPFGINSL
jgi:hypothetical protein